MKQLRRVLAAVVLVVGVVAHAGADPVWIDVRTAEEWQGGHLQQAVNIPHNQIVEHIGQVTSDKDAEILLYCRSGRRADVAKSALEALGYTHVVNVGGYEDALARCPTC